MSVLPKPALTPSRIIAFICTAAASSSLCSSSASNIRSPVAARCLRNTLLDGFRNRGP